LLRGVPQGLGHCKLIEARVEMDEKMTDGLSPAEPKLAKKPYQKPEFRFERVFETRALTCGKVHPTQSSCTHNRKNS
jgi:hypothetical protein